MTLHTTEDGTSDMTLCTTEAQCNSNKWHTLKIVYKGLMKTVVRILKMTLFGAIVKNVHKENWLVVIILAVK